MADKKNNVGQDRLFRREVPKMPEGYYSGDKPNPNLRAFVEQYIKENPYDAEIDDYDVPAFDNPIATTKATAIYNMHSYHQGKKPHDAIRQYIRHYTKPGDLVLDPFCGSGGTNLATLMEGRRTIAIDRSPAATFITKNYCTPIDLVKLQSVFKELEKRVVEIGWLYETRCDRCGGKATIEYTIYSQVYQCQRCMGKVPLFDCVEVITRGDKGKSKKINACPVCYQHNIVEAINTRGEKFGSIPVMVSYSCESGCDPSNRERVFNDVDEKKRDYFHQYDMETLRKINEMEIPYWYPKNRFPKEFHLYKRCALHLYGIENVSDLFTKRNLWALAAYYAFSSYADEQSSDVIRFGLNGILLAMSRLQGFSNDKRFPNQLMRGTYYIPPVGKEYNVMRWIGGKLSNLIAGYKRIESEHLSSDICISTQSAVSLNNIPSNSVDYIFTDPPYADKVFYGELNFAWESWLKFDPMWIEEEIVVKPDGVFTRELWNKRMKAALQECYRVLKPGRMVSLCFHGKPEDWQMVQDVMSEIGFLVQKSKDTLFIETMQKSYRQLTASDNTLRDLVINFRKPKLEELGKKTIGRRGEQTFREEVVSIISDLLEATPGSTKDRIYDSVVSLMVRAGRMEAHNFEELLRQVADEIREPIRKDLFHNEDPNLFGTHEISRWYLKESHIDSIDSAESAKEDSAAESVYKFIEKYLDDHPEKEGVHYSDIFEHFIYAVKDKPRRPLAEWLLDYLYKTVEGTYRLPISEEEKKLKAEGRSKGTNRRIKRYISFLEQGVTIPEKERPNDATLAEWIRHCKRSGLYEQGKLLYERGGLNLDDLPEEAMVNVEEDYQTCIRMLSRVSGKK